MRFFTKILKTKPFIYGVGIPKSGTTSLTAILNSALPMTDEEKYNRFAKLYLRNNGRDVGQNQLLLVKREMLERNYKPPLVDFIESLFFLCPNSKYILIVREPYAWVHSIIKQQRSYPPTANVKREDRNFKFGGYEFADEEATLRENGLYTLSGYLSHWANRNRAVLNTVPPNKLLVVRTDRLNSSLDAMALFCGVKAGSLLPKHENKSRIKSLSIRELDRDFVEAKVQEHCGELMRELFPDIRSSADSPVYQAPI